MDNIILKMNNITKLFPGVKALDRVNIEVEKGEIHALWLLSEKNIRYNEMMIP